MRAFILGPALLSVLACCARDPAPEVPVDPRLQTLVSQPVGDFLAEARIASLLARGCSTAVMPQEVFTALVIARETSPDRKPLIPALASRAADAAFRIRVADLRRRHGRDPFRDPTCDVIEAETRLGAPATGFLVPVQAGS